MLTRPQKQFLHWMKLNQPAVYAAATRSANETATLGAADTTPAPTQGQGWWGNFIDAAKQLVPVIVQAKSQKDILDVQLTRARQGLPPLNTSQIAPTVQIQAGLTPALKRVLVPAMMIGVGLLFFMMSKKKRR